VTAPEAPESSAGNAMLLGIGGSTYAIPVAAVREIVRLPPVTRVPGLPTFVTGLTNVRGRVLAVLDLRPLLNVEAPRGDRLVIIDRADTVFPLSPVVNTAAGRGVIGLVVDSALDLVALPEGGLEPLPPGVPVEACAVLDGITVIDGVPVAVLSPPGLLGLRSRLPGAA
jgi:purine-binding chemotaxis protein CheW